MTLLEAAEWKVQMSCITSSGLGLYDVLAFGDAAILQ